MTAILDRPGAGPPPETVAETDEYSCACAGYRRSNLMLMCLRCLDAYSSGLPLVLSGDRLQFEMQRVAKRLAVLLKGDQLLANLPVETVIRAAERSPDAA